MDALARSQGILRSASDPLIPAIRVGEGRYSERFLKGVDRALSFQPRDRPQTLAEWERELSLTPLTSGEDVAEPTVVRITEPPPLAGEHNWRNEYTGRRRVLRQQAATRAAAWRWGILTVLCAALFGTGILVWVGKVRVLTAPAESTTQPKAPIPSADPLKTDQSATKPSKVRPPAKRPADARLATEGEAKPKEAERTVDKLLELAERAMQREELGVARSYVDRASATLPRHRAIAPVREALEKRIRATAARPSLARKTSEGKRVKRFIELAIRSMDDGDFDRAKHYVDQAATIRPKDQDVISLRDELISRKAQGHQENEPDPADVDRPTAGGGAVLGRNHIAVRIQNARSSLSTARPGDTVEFFTQYSLTLPPGRRAEYVEATWILIRNGKKLGEEGVVGGMFEAGHNSVANRLTLPRRIMSGEYVVEHRVRSGTSYDTARSDFSVVRD